MKLALRSWIKMAGWIGERRAKLKGGNAPVDRCLVSIEGIQVGYPKQRRAVRTIHVENIINGLQDKPVAGTKRLVGRFDGELIPVVREALVEKVETIEAGDNFGI